MESLSYLEKLDNLPSKMQKFIFIDCSLVSPCDWALYKGHKILFNSLNNSIYELYGKPWRKEFKNTIHLPLETSLSGGREKTDFDIVEWQKTDFQSLKNNCSVIRKRKRLLSNSVCAHWHSVWPWASNSLCDSVYSSVTHRLDAEAPDVGI